MLELGMLGARGDDRLSSGDIRKIEIIRDLAAAGLPLTALAAELKSGRLSLDFMDNPVFDMFSALTDQTFDELSASTRHSSASSVGHPRSHRCGRAQPNRSRGRQRVGRRCPDRRTACERIFACGGRARTAHHGRQPPAPDDGRRGRFPALRDRAGCSTTWCDWRRDRRASRQRDAADRRTVRPRSSRHLPRPAGARLDGEHHAKLGSDLAAAGLYSAMKRPPAVCFLDLTGFTRLTAEQGDEAAAELAHDLAEARATDLHPARRAGGEVAGRWRDVLLPRSWVGRPGRARNGGRGDRGRIATGTRRPGCRAGRDAGR